jgi:Intracellular proteinase inhibitor
MNAPAKELNPHMQMKPSLAPRTLAFVLTLCAAMAPGISEAQSSDPVRVLFTADKSDYTRGDQALLTLEVKNTSSLPLVVSFSSGKQYDFEARDASGATLWAWSHGRSFDPSGSQRVLSPGETWIIQETWTFVSNDGQAVLDGSYTVRGTFLGNYLGKSGSKFGEQTVTLSTPDSIQAVLTTNKSSYGRFEQAALTLTVTNVAPYAQTVVFNSAQLFDFSAINSAGATVWTWSNGRTFDPTPQEVVLQPGESLQFQETWNLSQNNGMPAASGTYTVRGTFLGSYYGQVGTKSADAQVQVRPLL